MVQSEAGQDIWNGKKYSDEYLGYTRNLDHKIALYLANK